MSWQQQPKSPGPQQPYTGRFAPSPTGALHDGSLVAALASWLDARAHRGRWLVRIEDVDSPRCVPGADRTILNQLAACGLQADEPPVWQSQRGALYEAALARLERAGLAYPCGCTRSEIADLVAARSGEPAQRHAAVVYPGTCRDGLDGKAARAWRVRTDRTHFCASNDAQALDGKAHPAITSIALPTVSPPGPLHAAKSWPAQHVAEPQDEPAPMVRWHDRRAGWQSQAVEREVGDFVLRRADGLWAYQLAVVVDDADQGITDVVRGADLLDNTARQIQLQRLLGLPTPRYLHIPVVCNAAGEKLSKQSGAPPFGTSDALPALWRAAQFLGLEHPESVVPDGAAAAHLLARWIAPWRVLAQAWSVAGPLAATYNPPP